MSTVTATERAEALQTALLALARAVQHEETAQGARIAAVLPRHHRSAVNLAHYQYKKRSLYRRLAVAQEQDK